MSRPDSRHDIVYNEPPLCWQDGLILGNGSLGSIFYAPELLTWIVNKTEVIDGRCRGVRKVIPRGEAEKYVSEGASPEFFDNEERSTQCPEGIGPKTCCKISIDPGLYAGAGTRSALPSIRSNLSLLHASLSISLKKHLYNYEMESFVCSNADILVIKAVSVSPLISRPVRIFFSPPEDIELDSPVLQVRENRIVIIHKMPEGVSWAAAAEVFPCLSPGTNPHIEKIRTKYSAKKIPDVTAAVKGRYGIFSAADSFELYVTVATSLDGAAPAEIVHDRLEKIKKQKTSDTVHGGCTSFFDLARKEHRAYWKNFWEKSQVTIDDSELEALFYRSLYALGSTYRKAPLPGLTGLWYGPGDTPVQTAPWHGDLHHDLNVQCPFFPVFTLNHAELFEPYLDAYHSFLPEARRLAKEIWKVEGAHFDMGFTILGKSVMGGVGKYRFFFGGSYIALMHCISWKYCRNIKKLKDRIYPFLKEVLAFYCAVAKKGDDGKYHYSPAHACELDILNTADPVQVVSMLKICLDTAIEAADVLKEKETGLIDTWKEIRSSLRDYPEGTDCKGRNIVIDAIGIHPDHHTGQAGALHPLYPCGEISDISHDDIIALYSRTLDSVVDKTAEKSYADSSGYHYKCVWECFFRAMSALRLGRTKEFHELYLPMFLRAYVKPNGLISHDAVITAPETSTEQNLSNIPDSVLLDRSEQMPKFECWSGLTGGASPNPAAKRWAVPLIEGSGDYLTMITECLLQSHNGLIRIFPAWPADKAASFDNLIAEGPFAVSSAIRNGEVSFIHVRKMPDCTRNEFCIKLPWTKSISTIKIPASGCVTINNPQSKDTL